MLEHRIEKELFQTVIQKLTFSYSIPFSTLCEFSYRYQKADEIFYDEDYVGIPEEECTNWSKKYRRVFERLCVESYKNQTIAFLIEKPKIYDEFLFESQMNIYNSSAKVIGYNLIQELLPLSLIKSAAFLDGSQDYDTIAKYYPYYLPEKRDKLNFLEFIMLLNLGVEQRSRGLYTLDQKLENKLHEKRAKEMVEKIIVNMNTQEMYEIYVHTFFDIVDHVIYKIYQPLAEKCVRKYWLPEKYKNRKDVFAALETYNKKKSDPHSRIIYSTPPFEKDSNTANIFELVETNKGVYERIEVTDSELQPPESVEDLEKYSAIYYILVNIIPVTFNILLDEYKGTEADKKEKEYILAKEYAKVIDSYIRNSMHEAQEILKKLYIENNSPLRK